MRGMPVGMINIIREVCMYIKNKNCYLDLSRAIISKALLSGNISRQPVTLKINLNKVKVFYCYSFITFALYEYNKS